MSMVRTFIVHVANHPGVLNRVSSLFRRRGYNIESLTVGHTHIPDISRMTVVVGIDAQGAPLVRANLYKLAEVLHIEDITEVPSVHRELAIVKVSVSPATHQALMHTLESADARVLEESRESLVVEITGTEEIIDSFIEEVRPYGIHEVTRTGRVAMTHGSAPAFLRSGLKPSPEALAACFDPAESAVLPRNC
jgi:acetolactate synthase-1/3 small subunit